MPALLNLAKRFGVDRAVSYAMAARLWQIPSGVVTALLIALFFDPNEQGIYYLILTLTGLQALADAGLINTILHAASHEAAGARFGRLGFFRANGRARARLAGLFRFALIWFSIAAILLALVGIVAGAILLERQNFLGAAIAPLSVAMVLAAIALAVAPLIAILEGCEQVQTVNQFRLGQAVSGSVVVWLCLSTGAGLWTAAVAIATQLIWELVLLGRRYRRFLYQLARTTPGHFDWRKEIWPLQWRIGVQSAVRYLAFFPILPVLFDSHGPELAGQYGMTWQVMSGLMMVAYAYVRTRSPEFGRLIAENRRAESNAAFKRVTLGSTLILIILTVGFCMAILILGQFDWEYARKVAGRFLPVDACLWFAVALVPVHLTQCFAMFIRSQRFDPIWRVNLPNCLTLMVLVFFAARSGHVEWIAASIALTFTLSAITLGWMYRWYERHFQALAE